MGPLGPLKGFVGIYSNGLKVKGLGVWGLASSAGELGFRSLEFTISVSGSWVQDLKFRLINFKFKEWYSFHKTFFQCQICSQYAWVLIGNVLLDAVGWNQTHSKGSDHYMAVLYIFSFFLLLLLQPLSYKICCAIYLD